MALCVEVGNNTSALGLCCIAIGDDVSAIGAFQVKVSDTLTLPDLKENEVKVLIARFKKMIEIYQAMTDQGHAPPKFSERAESALNVAIGAFEKKILLSSDTKASSMEREMEEKQ